jgi:hypothetical protein
MEKINDLMQKDMTRREFLTAVGLGLASIFGFAAILRILTGKSLGAPQQNDAYGYGSGPYGGPKTT